MRSDVAIVLDSRASIDVTKEAQMVMSCVIRMGQRFGKR